MTTSDRTSEHLARREIEAEMIGRIYREMCRSIGSEQALEILTRVIEGAAREEGAAFALSAPGGPCLEHFKSIMEHWGDALQITDLRESGETLQFEVTRCEYIAFYRSLGLPQEMVELLSCRRDAPFAKGYSTDLELSRSRTLARGADGCDFHYRWRSHRG